MNTPTHNWHTLAHYGLRGHEHHRRALRNQRLMVRLGWLLLAGLFLASASQCAHAYEPSNAPDVRGKFVLVVAGWGTVKDFPMAYNGLNDFKQNTQPLVIPGFDSFYRCRGAGMEMQARFNTDGYTLDFVCLLQGK